MSDDQDRDVQQAPEASSRESFIWCGVEIRKAAIQVSVKPTEVRKWREVPK